MSSTRTNEPKKKRRFGQYLENLKAAYTVSHRTFPWIGWALGGVLVGVIALAVLVSLATGQSLGYWIAMSVPLSLMAALVLLTLVTRRASYAQIEGTPGAAKYVLDQAGKGWYVHSSPLAVNPSTQDILWFLVGRPGIVLVAEGPKGRTQRMVTDESKRIQRFLSTVPLHVISVGTQEGQTRLTELRGALRRLPTKPIKLTDAEITQVAKRLTSLSSKALPIPKGIDPARYRPDRRALRGR